MTPCPTPYKRYWPTHRQAKDHARRIRKVRKVKLYIYPCRRGGYHVTRQEQWPVKEWLTRVLWEVRVAL